MQIIQKEITRSDFEKACKLNNLEYFTSDQVESWLKDSKTLIEKSQTEELDDIEKSLVDEFTVTAPNLNLVSVLNDDLTKSVVYVRPSQIDWDKDENGDLMKAKSGTYSDTPENRKLGRVGQKYGGSKGEEKKEGGRITKEDIHKGIKKWAEGKSVAYSLKVTDVSSENHNSFVIEPSYYKGDSKYDGMQINYEDGVYEVSEMQAGESGNDIKIFLETKSLIHALNSLDRGNKQKTKSVIDMSPNKDKKEDK